MVSIILPNYNHASFLQKRIDSILNQTYQDFELIIIDDYSTDNSREIINSYSSNSHIAEIVFNDFNSKIAFKQWNKGVKLSKGDFIWIAESDDIAKPEFLEVLMKPMLEDNNTVMAYSSSKQVDKNDEDATLYGIHITPFEYDDIFKNDFIISGIDFLANYMFKSNFIPNASAVVFRKDVYLKTGMADEDMILMGDWLQWNKMMLAGNVFYTKDVLNIFRVHSETNRERITRDKQLQEYIKVLDSILKNAASNSVIHQNVLDAFSYRVKNNFFMKKRIGLNEYMMILRFLQRSKAKRTYQYFVKSMFAGK
jgi:glycosyltransferase involved in cell wall biosynthesis